MPVYDEGGRRLTQIGQLIDRRDFIRRVMDKYKIESIDVINALKKGLAIARRSHVSISIKDFYQRIEETVDKCIEGRKINMVCFEKIFHENITKIPPLPQIKEEEDVTRTVDEIVNHLRTARELVINLGKKRVDVRTLDGLIEYLKGIIELIETLRKIKDLEQRLLK